MAATPATKEKDTARFGVTRLEHETLHVRVYRELKKAIMSGAIRPGETMTIRALAAALGTSPMPVREALRRLVAERALDMLPNRTVTLPVMTAARFREISRLRMALEGMLAEAAAGHLTAADLTRLAELHAGMQKRGPAKRRDYLVMNQEFHFIIYQAANMPVTTPIVESLWLQIGPLLHHVTTDLGVDHATVHHGDALAALKREDGPAARAAIEGDIGDAADVIGALIRAPSGSNGCGTTRTNLPLNPIR